MNIDNIESIKKVSQIKYLDQKYSFVLLFQKRFLHTVQDFKKSGISSNTFVGKIDSQTLVGIVHILCNT